MRESDAIFLPIEGGSDQLAQLKTYLTGAKLHATKALVIVNQNTTNALLSASEADYTGYAAVVLTWATVGVTVEGFPVIASQRVRFQQTGPDPVATPEQLYNLWVATPGAAGPPVVPSLCEMAATLSAGLPLQNAEQFVDATVYYALTSTGVTGWIDVEH